MSADLRPWGYVADRTRIGGVALRCVNQDCGAVVLETGGRRYDHAEGCPTALHEHGVAAPQLFSYQNPLGLCFGCGWTWSAVSSGPYRPLTSWCFVRLPLTGIQGSEDRITAIGLCGPCLESARGGRTPEFFRNLTSDGSFR